MPHTDNVHRKVTEQGPDPMGSSGPQVLWEVVCRHSRGLWLKALGPSPSETKVAIELTSCRGMYT